VLRKVCKNRNHKKIIDILPTVLSPCRYSFITGIKKSTGAAIVCLGSGLESDVPIYQPMHPLNQASDFPLGFSIERLRPDDAVTTTRPHRCGYWALFVRRPPFTLH